MNKIYDDNGILLYLIHCGLTTRLLFTLTLRQKRGSIVLNHSKDSVHTRYTRIRGVNVLVEIMLKTLTQIETSAQV